MPTMPSPLVLNTLSSWKGPFASRTDMRPSSRSSVVLWECAASAAICTVLPLVQGFLASYVCLLEDRTFRTRTVDVGGTRLNCSMHVLQKLRSLRVKPLRCLPKSKLIFCKVRVCCDLHPSCQ